MKGLFCRVAAGLTLAAAAASPAAATEGYFQAGYGTLQKAVAGAGVANPGDAMALSINPAGLVDLPQMITGGVSAFMPFRGYTASGPGFAAPGALSGTVNSGSNFFVMPNIAYSSPIDATTAWGIAMYGNGGMNTSYPSVLNPNGQCPGIGVGVFCGGPTGVDLKQMFISVGIAKRFGNVSIGIAPIFAMQMFRAEGLGIFAFPPFPFPPGMAATFSANPWGMSNNGVSTSVGGGARLGVEWKALPTLRIGIAGQTPMAMTPFASYSGLFADGGRFDIPGNITAGLAYDALPTLTLMAEYKHIFYSGVAAISNPGYTLIVPFVQPPGLGMKMGGAGGPGFGWHDVDVWTVAAEWRVTPDLSLRAGYAHNTNPVRWTDVTFNILAPGIVTDHITGGFGYKISPNSSIDFAGTFVPTHNVTGPEMTPYGFNTMRSITLSMHQFEASLGYSYKFGAAPMAVVAKY